VWTDKDKQAFLTMIVFILTFIATGSIATQFSVVPYVDVPIIAITVAGVVSLFYIKGD